MRILIISDLHANLEALRALPTNFDRLWVLGDLVNYGPNPAEVIEFVRERAAIVVRGNHDHAVGFDEDPRCSARFRAMAEETRRYTLSVLDEDDRNYLRKLPLEATPAVEGTRFLLCHAVPSDPLFEYRQEESPLWLADEVGSGIGIELVGHTHIPFRRLLETRMVVNPGSAGQPKHGRAEACYAIWQDGKVTLGSVAYDVEQTVAKLRRLALSPAVFEDLAFVLRNGRVRSAPADSSQ
ncbi:MAG TPA: metallophosphoesterase family protein [Bryobacteraceae bacterium]